MNDYEKMIEIILTADPEKLAAIKAAIDLFLTEEIKEPAHLLRG